MPSRDGFAMPYLFRLKTLIKLLEDEGFDPEEINAFLKEEMENDLRKEVQLELMEKLQRWSLWPSTTGKGYLLLLLISLGLGK